MPSSATHPATDEAGEAARQARSAMRSAQILSATARLMEREGSQAVSMQALAEEAGVSVGLIYRYFGGKEDLLFAVIGNVLAAFAERVPAAVAKAGADPVERLAAAFRSYCLVIDEHRHAAVLTYRESKTLSSEHRRKIKELEVSTSDPLRQLIVEGIGAGYLLPVDADLAAYDLLLVAHGWALKHWYFERTMTVDEYVAKQTELLVYPLVEPRRRRRYAGLLRGVRAPA
jgi:TetR/AcrR family transcriptional regulator, cholesterol catabolism regulator